MACELTVRGITVPDYNTKFTIRTLFNGKLIIACEKHNSLHIQRS